jgi:UDP-2,3-diacylglucosamine pyrophosphatase LpxH
MTTDFDSNQNPYDKSQQAQNYGLNQTTFEKKKIKLVVSDLHLGVGKGLPDGTLNTLEEFYFDHKFEEFISFYTSGKYEGFDVELVLNGDIFNFLQIDYKGHFVGVITESISVNKMQRIVSGHQLFFESLKKFSSLGHKITYIIGNHDQEMLWPRVREVLNEAVGQTVKFQNLFYFFDGVHIEHGHMHEAANRFNPKKFFLRKNLPEPILNLPFGSHFFIDCVLKLKFIYPHVDKVRPFGKALRWVFINKTGFAFYGFYKVISYFVVSVFVKDPRRSWSFKTLLKILRECAIFPDLSDSAGQILKDERVHTVVFGHTHVYQYRQWPGGKQYFNTGTWTDLTSLDVHSLGKITKLTYVLFEYPSEARRPYGCLKNWKGYHRVDEEVSIA